MQSLGQAYIETVLIFLRFYCDAWYRIGSIEMSLVCSSSSQAVNSLNLKRGRQKIHFEGEISRRISRLVQELPLGAFEERQLTFP